MRINEFDKQITSSDLEALETFADRIFAKVGIDVEFTRHFLDRVNDERNGKQITASELTRLFKQEYKRWGQPIAQMGPDAEAVMKDLATDINMPFALRWDKENEELDLIVKTVMRKPDFKTSNREFAIEGEDDLNEWNWRRPFHFPRPPVVGKPLPAKDSYGRGDVKTIQLPIGSFPGKLNASKKSKKNDKKLNAVREETVNEEPDYTLMAQKATMNLSDQAIIALIADLYKKLYTQINEKEEDCTACGGTGWDRSVTPDEDDRGCDECGGTGKIEEGGPKFLRRSNPPQKARSITSKKPMGIKKYRSLESIDEDSQIWKFNKEDPNNPEVLIQGFGRLMLNQIEDSVIGKLEDLVQRAKGRRDWQQINANLDSEVMQIMIKAIVDTKKDLEKTRKRGGPKSRGINKDISYESKERTSILDVIGENTKVKEFEKDFSKLNEFTLVDVKDMIKKGWMARPTEKQWKELIKIYNKYKGNVTRKDLIDLGIASIGRKESVEEAGGVGRVVPGINTSVDVGPNEIKKQAAKFGNAVDKDGVPKKNLR
jgi:hypothetical protein